MRRTATLALGTIAESTLPAIVKAALSDAVKAAQSGHTTTANWIPARALAERFGTARMQRQVEDIIRDIDLGAIARGGGA